jgi:putative Mn2+ efflux pump MntP
MLLFQRLQGILLLESRRSKRTKGAFFVTTIQILLIGIALSMDAVAVSITNGMVYKDVSRLKYLLIPIFFGVFQGLMPAGGYFVGGFFAHMIMEFAGIVILLILGAIGIKMIVEGVRKKTKEASKDHKKDLLIGVLLAQAIATSIDAFAVGVSFSVAHINNIIYAVSLIAATTFLLAGLGLIIGKKFGNILGNKAEIVGGIILIAIGINAVI